MPALAWRDSYDRVIASIPDHVARARLTLCGFNVCIDALLPLSAALPALERADEPAARSLAAELARRAAAGIGGEIRVDWPGGSDWLRDHLQPDRAMGGTGAHAARMLALLGAPALLALTDRSADQMSLVHPDILLAQDGKAIRAGEVEPRGAGRPAICIFEYTEGVRAGSVNPPRSSRIIVRFTDPGLEDDDQFDALAARLAPRAGAGIVSGLNAVAEDRLDPAIARMERTIAPWRAAGVPAIHLELAGYTSRAALDRVLDRMTGLVTSIGMSQSEFVGLVGNAGEPVARMTALATRLGVRRLCIHADDWAAAVTRDDPAQERASLMMGCLLAATRAARGQAERPVAIDPAARFADPPLPLDARHEGWAVVACAAPHLTRPATTLGLGDTFMAGCLLVLGASQAPARG